MKGILIVKLGSTFPDFARRYGDFEDWIRDRLDVPADSVSVVDGQQDGRLPEPQALAGAVLTGSHAMVTERADWSERTAAWLRGAVAAGLPVLGICYGHQLLTHALGGRVGRNPRGEELGTAEITLQEAARHDPLFAGLPVRLPVQVCHAESALELPSGATLLASGQQDPHQAFVVAKCAWGVQFHPEFDARVSAEYIERAAGELRAEGRDPAALLADIRETPESAELLRRFGRLTLGGAH